MRNIVQIASGVDVTNLALAIHRQPELWNRNKTRTEQYAHGDVSDIWVRYNTDSGDLKKMQEPHIPVWYPAYRALPQLRPIIFGLMSRVEGEMLGGVLITKIPSGSSVKPHVDKGWHAEYYEKYAVQLEGNEKQSFNFEGESLVTKPGDVYWFNNRVEHWVTNDSDSDRMTLIVCIKPGA